MSRMAESVYSLVRRHTSTVYNVYERRWVPSGNWNKFALGVSVLRPCIFWWFHVAVFQNMAKKCKKLWNALAVLFFSWSFVLPFSCYLRRLGLRKVSNICLRNIPCEYESYFIMSPVSPTAFCCRLSFNSMLTCPCLKDSIFFLLSWFHTRHTYVRRHQ